MSSTSDDNGSYTLTITFDVGTDPDIAQVKVQNRLQQVMSQLPALVVQEGVDVKTSMSNILGMLVLRSPNNTYNDLYLSNFAYTNIKIRFPALKASARLTFTARSIPCASGSTAIKLPPWALTVRR